MEYKCYPGVLSTSKQLFRALKKSEWNVINQTICDWGFSGYWIRRWVIKIVLYYKTVKCEDHDVALDEDFISNPLLWKNLGDISWISYIVLLDSQMN